MTHSASKHLSHLLVRSDARLRQIEFKNTSTRRQGIQGSNHQPPDEEMTRFVDESQLLNNIRIL